MIACLRGTVVEKGPDSLVLDVQGVGYEICMAPSGLRRIPDSDEPLTLYISESTAMYGGGTTLYGFPTREEKEIFLCLREHVPSTGAKKALEHLDKASKSLPDFRRAILQEDSRILAGVFGFSAKTAEKLIHALKDKLGVAGIQHAGAASAGGDGSPIAAGPGKVRAMQQALDVLIALGYKPAQSRQALQSLPEELRDGEATVEDIVRRALKQL